MSKNQMATRYSESRILVRNLCRPDGDSPKQFKSNVRLLKKYFEQFNVDISELCQWLMGLRPGRNEENHGTQPYWEFFLNPEDHLEADEHENADRYRCMVFDATAGSETEANLAMTPIPQNVQSIIRIPDVRPRTQSAINLFQRMAALKRSHRQILLKAAAEWIVSHYYRGYLNWERRREEWLEEKQKWEEGHPELSAEIRQRYTDIYKRLGVKHKRPRVCQWERLKDLKNDCDYAGKRIRVKDTWNSHSNLCIKYEEFQKIAVHKWRPFPRYFADNAMAYLALRETMSKPRATTQFGKDNWQAALWFTNAWNGYLNAMNINEETILQHGTTLPHCTDMRSGATCQHNHHTNECEEYRKIISENPDLHEYEKLYREWRSEYLSAPKKPTLRYPSKRILPISKIFGRNYFRYDSETSILELRLDNRPSGEFVRFGFAPWPNGYSPQLDEAGITSVHINFIGTRARAGFRFKIQHAESRFKITQDEIDELRSRKYPRMSQDQLFLDEARDMLLGSFVGERESEARILTVDLGVSGGAVALFQGRKLVQSELLKIIKIDKIYAELPKIDKAELGKLSPGERQKRRQRGLGRYHVGRHLESWASGAKKIAVARATEIPELGEHDMRHLATHIRGMLNDWVRHNTSQIIKSAADHDVDLIVFESMRGFRAPGYDILDEEKKRRFAFFAAGRIRYKTAEKAVERGMRVVTVPYLKSSQTCSLCGRDQEDKSRFTKNKRKRNFICEHSGCSLKCNSDENSARVLGRVFWGEIMLPVENT